MLSRSPDICCWLERSVPDGTPRSIRQPEEVSDDEAKVHEAAVGSGGDGQRWHAVELGLTLTVIRRQLLPIVLALVCAGCSAGSSTHSSAPTTAAPLPAPSSPDGSLQDAILADGVVTDAEFNSANQATVECIRRLGFDAEMLPDGAMTYSADESLADEVEAAAFACETEYNTRVQLRYSIGHLPPEFDVEAVWDCLEERGIVDRAANDDPVEAFQLADAADSAATGECIQKGRGG